MSDREWLYRLVLRAYPPVFRGSFGREMLLVYRAQRRDGVVGAHYWLACIADAVATAPGLWLDELQDGFLATGTAMRTMGILSVIVGLLEIANSLVELRASAFGERDALSQAVLALVIATSALLSIVGFALLFRGDAARRLGWIGAVAGFGTFSLMLAARPMMSFAATTLGIAFPLALRIFLHVSRGGVATRLTA